MYVLNSPHPKLLITKPWSFAFVSWSHNDLNLIASNKILSPSSHSAKVISIHESQTILQQKLLISNDLRKL